MFERCGRSMLRPAFMRYVLCMTIELNCIAVRSTVTACGGEGAGFACERKVKPPPMKQESNCMAKSSITS